MLEKPTLYTQEIAILSSGLAKADIKEPVTVYVDTAGNHALADGNHRSFKGYLQREEPERIVIGSISKDVSHDPNFRCISDLKVINK